MIDIIKSRAKRIFRGHENYYEITDKVRTKLSSLIQVEPEEELLGIYYNNPQEVRDCVVISKKGFHIIYCTFQQK